MPHCKSDGGTYQYLPAQLAQLNPADFGGDGPTDKIPLKIHFVGRILNIEPMSVARAVTQDINYGRSYRGDDRHAVVSRFGMQTRNLVLDLKYLYAVRVTNSWRG